MARGSSLKRLRARYSGKSFVPKPASIDQLSWEIFAAYFYEGRTLEEITATTQISRSRARQVLHEVDAQLMSARPPAPEMKRIDRESPIEDLALSSRARNALRGLGCGSVDDVLRLNLQGSVRGIGNKTRVEVFAALRSSGLPHPEWDDLRESEIRRLSRNLERVHTKVSAALGTVAREIAAVQKRLRKYLETRNGGSPMESGRT